MKRNMKGILSKCIAVGSIIGILIIGLACISGKKNDRKNVYENAVHEIQRAAGGNVHIKGMYIAIPYVKIIYKEDFVGGVKKMLHEYETGVMKVAPEKFDVTGQFNTTIRRVGIYSAPVYKAKVHIQSEFNVFCLKETNISYDMTRAMLYVEMEASSLTEMPSFKINEKEYGTDSLTVEDETMVGVRLPVTNGKLSVSTDLAIRGAETFDVLPAGKSTHMQITGDWPSPGFTNFTWLPDSREVTDKGFSAEWFIPFNGINVQKNDSCKTSIGFEYIDPVDLYRKLDRSLSYGFLFIIVPFLIFFLFEIFAKISFHPMHYLLSGAACVIFFLLLLALSEHIPFGVSYLLSAGAVSLLVSLYVGSVTKKVKLGFCMMPLFVLLYGYLYASLQSEDYALLIGALFAFIVLAIVMFCTRKIDWNAIGHTEGVQEEVEK